MASKVWFIKDNKIGFGSLANGKVTNLSATTGAAINVHYYKRDSAFTTSLGVSPSFPSQFHEALVFKVLERLSATGKDPKMANYWKREYESKVREALAYKNQNRIEGFEGVIPHYF